MITITATDTAVTVEQNGELLFRFENDCSYAVAMKMADLLRSQGKEVEYFEETNSNE